jgi:hypothetical protein
MKYCCLTIETYAEDIAEGGFLDGRLIAGMPVTDVSRILGHKKYSA